MKYIIMLIMVLSVAFSGCTNGNGKNVSKTEELENIDNNKEIVKNIVESETEETKTPEAETSESDNTIEIGENELSAQDYIDAISEETKSEIFKTAKNYYANLKFLEIISLNETTEMVMYKNKGIEDQYAVGDILVLDVVAEMDGEKVKRTISIVRDKDDMWKVINEGF